MGRTRGRGGRRADGGVGTETRSYGEIKNCVNNHSINETVYVINISVY